MSESKQSLEWVMYGSEEHELYMVGKAVSFGVVENIFLAMDGHGLSGYYDRIHVITSGEHFVLPAHHCHQWKLSMEQEG